MSPASGQSRAGLAASVRNSVNRQSPASTASVLDCGCASGEGREVSFESPGDRNVKDGPRECGKL